MTVLWLSKAESIFACDLVFVVADILPFQEALAEFESQDSELARRHFRQSMLHHPEVLRADAKTYVADMTRSYIPHPAVSLETEIDAVRQQEKPWSKPLAIAWGRRTRPLRVDAIDDLERIVRDRAEERLLGPLGQAGWSPGEEEALR